MKSGQLGQHKDQDQKSRNASQLELSQISLQSGQVAEDGLKKKKSSHKDKASKEYNFLQIPPNWDLARIHAQSRETKPELGTDDIQDICECCGYEINRKQITLNVDLFDLGFLGSGFPLFYNYLKNCVVMLTFLFLVQGIPNIIINYQGTYCHFSSLDAFEHAHHQSKHPKENFKEFCVVSKIAQLSIANILDQPSINSFSWWSLGAMILQILLTIYFRKQQKDMDCQIDEQNVTPADYSVLVQNIPKEMDNIKDNLKRLFTYQAVPGRELNVAKIVLIYDIAEIIKLEEQIEEKIKHKQQLLNIKFDLNNEQIAEIDHQLHQLHHSVHQLEHEIEHNPEKFTGQAIISFETEQEKNLVLENNQTNQFRRFINYFSGGKSEKQSHQLYMKDRHLYVEQAPEPAEIDWEFAHCSTKEKIIARIGTNILTILLIGLCFSVIACLTYWQSKMIDEAYEELFEEQLKSKKNTKGDVNNSNLIMIQSISIIISIVIVIFNKFCLPFTIHQIVDHEKWFTKTNLNISFARKLTLALFTNTALITFFVEIIFFKNYYGIGGGMIYGEYLVFISNCIIPALAWIIDPWSLIKNCQRNRELKKGNQSSLTQKQANILMEHPDYAMGKRYADVMKTMWFTFFYSPVIPLATVWSILGVILYYITDKYNLIYRRTVKESIGKGLTIEMIEMIEYCVVLHCFGNFFFKYQLFGTYEISNLILLGSAMLINILPMQDLNDWLFPSVSDSEQAQYKDVEMYFDSDYDRENPVTKNNALKKLMTTRTMTRQSKVGLQI